MVKISDTIDKGIAYAERGDYPRALETLKGLFQRYPDNPDVLYNYGRLCNDLRDFGESTTVFERLVSIQPEYKNAKVALAFAYLHLKKAAEAETLLEEAYEIDPGNPFLLRNLGTIYAQNRLERRLMGGPTCEVQRWSGEGEERGHPAINPKRLSRSNDPRDLGNTTAVSRR